ncbi:hypothetical protein C8J57DRAFT_1229595 [Mycena rebaudengoi]|nr:hypothetical protein C8J57DRAFT_1229595 [Mycena rebaudengoi]
MGPHGTALSQVLSPIVGVACHPSTFEREPRYQGVFRGVAELALGGEASGPRRPSAMAEHGGNKSTKDAIIKEGITSRRPSSSRAHVSCSMSRNRGGRPQRDSTIDFVVEDNEPEVKELVAEHGIYFSADGRRRDEELHNLSHKKRRVKPSDLDNSFAEWIPVRDEDYEGNGATAAPILPTVTADSVLRKRKAYASSDNPMSEWRPLQDVFQDELLHHDGLADETDEPSCGLCTKRYAATAPSDSDVPQPVVARIFKCRTCGAFLQCQECCLAEHARRPLHVIEEWDGTSWVDASLRTLGLVYQLGHGGLPCIYPDSKINTMTVLDTHYVHRVHFRYCKCSRSDYADNIQQLLRNSWWPASVTSPAMCATFETLEMYRLLNVTGNINAHDFIKTLERATNATASTGMDWIPHRYTQFQRMAHQWAFSKRAKHQGRGLAPSGVVGTQIRELAVDCWACPHDGRNLPEGWHDVEPKFKFLFMLLLALDTNFKLKNRMRPNEIDDLPLGPGWGYFITTCIAFAALLQKDTWVTKGLRCSGIGGAVYVNMDFILMACLVGFSLLMLTISYDIACQWECVLPVWHATCHEDECQNQNSLSFKKGVGKSDGEGGGAYDAGKGVREDMLEDKIDNHNFLKNIGKVGDALKRKLVVAIAEQERQIEAFKACSRTVKHDVLKLWQADIDVWLADKRKPNPYALPQADCPTEAETRLDLKKEETAEAAEGSAAIQGTSAVAFLVAGLQLEDAQWRIITEMKGTRLVAADRQGKIEEQRTTLVSWFLLTTTIKTRFASALFLRSVHR